MDSAYANRFNLILRGANMSKPVTRSPQPKQSKSEKIHAIYGMDKGNSDLEKTSEYLKSIGFKSLGDLLHPAR